MHFEHTEKQISSRQDYFTFIYLNFNNICVNNNDKNNEEKSKIKDKINDYLINNK